MLQTIVLTCLIAGAAVLYSAVGHAGASGYIAAMALLGVEPAVMKPTALLLNLIVASIAAVRFAGAGYFSWELLWPFALGSVPFAFIGGAWQLPGDWYKRAVGLVLIVAAARLLVESLGRRDAPTRTRPVAGAIACGAAIGLLAGLTGTGGGIFLSPLLLFTRWADTRATGGVTAAFILMNSAAGLAGNLASVRMVPAEAILWAVAAATGGLIGSELGSRRIGSAGFRRVLTAVLLVAAAKLLFT